MNISLKVQKWGEENHVRVSKIEETEDFLVISMNGYISLHMSDIDKIRKILKENSWNLHSIDYNPTKEAMEIWFSR